MSLNVRPNARATSQAREYTCARDVLRLESRSGRPAGWALAREADLQGCYLVHAMLIFLRGGCRAPDHAIARAITQSSCSPCGAE